MSEALPEHAPIDPARILAGTFVAHVEWHDVLGSTNDRAKELAEQPDAPRPLLVVAERQTAGRGRGANRWWTGPGSLAMSLLLGPESLPSSPSAGSLVSLASAVAVVEAVRLRVPDCPVGLQWPNDVMAEGRKLCGILIEMQARRTCVVGIGLNVNNSAADAPGDLVDRVATLGDLTGRPHDRTELAIDVLWQLDERLKRLRRRPEAIAREADAMCLQKDRELTVQCGSETLKGHCVGIADDGALLLDTPTGRRAITSGIVQ